MDKFSLIVGILFGIIISLIISIITKPKPKPIKNSKDNMVRFELTDSILLPTMKMERYKKITYMYCIPKKQLK